ncbi:hypothetical protein AB3N59_02685 [Leptospira sp. WS92.C1]
MKRIVCYKPIILFFIIFACYAPKPNLWNIPKDFPELDLVTVRRFNAGIRAIDGVAFTFNRDDVTMMPGKHSINIQPEMWISTFPHGEHLEQVKTVNFEAKSGEIVYLCLGLKKSNEWNPYTVITQSGEIVYLCLGLKKSNEWNPYTVITQSGENPTQRLLFAMEKKGGCVSSRNTLPVIWTDP